MSTERLYFADPYCTHFSARVVARDERGGHPAVALDQTAFYPEGGGQPSDHGTLNGVVVRDVQADNGQIWHMLDAPLPDDAVQGVVDWARRFDHMQQHHGQHLLSAAFERLDQARTLSFHLGSATSTIDLDTPTLTDEQAVRAEALVNQVIWEDRPVLARFVTPEELSALPLRKPPSVQTAVRVVSVPEFDHSACGGTHPRTTGGVGLLHIRRWERRGDVTRVEFLCGGRALADYRSRDRLVAQLALEFSVSVDELAEAMARLRAAEERSRKQARATVEQLLHYEAQELLASADLVGIYQVVHHTFEGRDFEELRTLARNIAARGGIALLGSRGERAQLVLAAPETAQVHCGTLLRTTLTAFGGRGGGQPVLAQGGLPDSAQLPAVMDRIRDALGQV